MSNGFAEAFAPVMELNRAIVARNTWGHLAPEPQKKYYGWVIVAMGIGGNNIIFDYEFDGLPDSPWFAEDLDKFAFGETASKFAGLYQWSGWYKKFRNGNFHFGGGGFHRLEIPSCRQRARRERRVHPEH